MQRLIAPLVLVLSLVLLVATAGCLDMEAGVAFNKDMTGTATFKMTMDMGAILNKVVDGMAARGGGPPPADLMPMLTSQLATQFGNGMVNVDELKKTLPEGVTLTNSSQSFADLKMVMNFAFAFKDASKLADIALVMTPPPGAGVPAGASPPIKPFDIFAIKDEGDTISIGMKAKEPAAGAAVDPEKAKADVKAAVNDAKSQLDQAGLGSILDGASMRVAYRFDVPQTVLEQNATRKEGTAYIWETKLDNVTSLDKLPEPTAMKLRFKKK
jgi:hypothetical protein